MLPSARAWSSVTTLLLPLQPSRRPTIPRLRRRRPPRRNAAKLPLGPRGQRARRLATAASPRALVSSRRPRAVEPPLAPTPRKAPRATRFPVPPIARLACGRGGAHARRAAGPGAAAAIARSRPERAAAERAAPRSPRLSSARQPHAPSTARWTLGKHGARAQERAGRVLSGGLVPPPVPPRPEAWHALPPQTIGHAGRLRAPSTAP